MNQTSRPLTRAEAKLLTRHRLMQAALNLLAQEGRVALTTSSVTRAAGVAQPTFYVHFDGMESLLSSLATEALNEVRTALHAARAPLFEGGDLMEASRGAYRLSLRAIRQHAALLTVFLAERYKPASELGRQARDLLDTLQADLVTAANVIPAARAIPLARRQLVARGLVALTIEFGLAQRESKAFQEDEAVSLLCSVTQSLILAAATGS
ncbi:MAG: TetR/AcrR family transcriptional regulator [Burkholderiales bacterium]|nr:TetR/AcrR family transcriptional regulator [Burkholderiales bacterium]